MSVYPLKIIARIRSDFTEKFGIPRQSGLAPVRAEIVFEPEYRCEAAVRGLEGFSHIWLIWQFSEAVREQWQPTVRPPRLGGNARMGVFATRAPYRPNAIGLSSVRLLQIAPGPVLIVEGADLMNGTPIFDIKPYLPYTDSHPGASGGFAEEAPARLTVCRVEGVDALPEGLEEALSLDPRPAYQHGADRIYGMNFGAYALHFQVEGNTLTVLDIRRVK